MKRSGVTEINTGYAYDLMDRMTSVTEGGAVIASYTYDDNGNRLTLTNSNGTSAAYSYNQSNLVTSIANKKGSSTLSSYAYEYQLDGNQTKKTDHTGKATSYRYDGLGRLVEESESGGNKLVYAYDAQGNRKTMTASGAESYTATYTYDANNRLLEEYTLRGKTREYRKFRYDANRNQLTKEWERFAPIGTATASVGFQKKSDVEMFESRVYNGFNQLVSVFVDNVSAAYTYRPDGLRHSKEAFDYKSTQNTVHLWDGQNICAEQNASGVFARYLRGANLIARRQDNLNQYYHFNAHGDVVQRTDHNGVMLKSYIYDAFGVEKNIEPLDSNPFRFCGEYFDKETKTVYLRARYYSPALGRFGAEDSAKDGLNWYTYCGNNPIRHIDPTGHWANIAIGGLIGGAIGWGTNLFTQLAGNGWNLGAVNQRSLWAATGAGVLTGAMAGATMGASLLGSAALGAVVGGALIGGAGYGAYNILNGTPATLGGYAGAMVSSGATAGIMHGVTHYGMNKPVTSVTVQQESPSALARSWQGSGDYPGVDKWADVQLAKGTYVWGGSPGQSYFYTTNTVIQSVGNDATRLYAGLQVGKLNYPSFRQGMTMYQVTENITVGYAQTLANTQFGAGGFPQYFIPNYQNVLIPVLTRLMTNL